VFRAVTENNQNFPKIIHFAQPTEQRQQSVLENTQLQKTNKYTISKLVVTPFLCL